MHDVLGHAKFKGSIFPLRNHRLYREENVFLYPSFDYIKLTRLSKGIINLILPNRYNNLKMSYYHGKLLSKLTVHCVRCDKQRSEIEVKRNKYYNMEINFPTVSEAMLVTSKAIEYAQGLIFRYNVSASFDFHPEPYGRSVNPYKEDRIWIDSKSWVSSTIYHINCSKSVVENSNWSNLATSTISNICELKTKDNFSSGSRNYLEPPKGLVRFLWSHFSVPSVRTLLLHIEKSNPFKGDQFGHIVFQTNIDRLCDHRSIEEAKSRHQHSPHEGFNVSCAVLRSETVLHVKTEKGVNVFQLWYKFFEDSSLFFRPKLFMNNGTRTNEEFIKLKYKWFRNNKIDNWQENNRIYDPHTKFSWKMAAERCQQDNKILPYFQNRKSALEFAMRILNYVDYPTFATFAGLISKV